MRDILRPKRQVTKFSRTRLRPRKKDSRESFFHKDGDLSFGEIVVGIIREINRFDAEARFVIEAYGGRVRVLRLTDDNSEARAASFQSQRLHELPPRPLPAMRLCDVKFPHAQTSIPSARFGQSEADATSASVIRAERETVSRNLPVIL